MSGDNPSDKYACATRMIGHALTLGDDPAVWVGLAFVLEQRLSAEERARLLRSAVRSMQPDDVFRVLDDELSDASIGSPLPILIDIEDDARWWADLATLPELKAWLVACFVRLSMRDQQEFLAIAMRRVAA